MTTPERIWTASTNGKCHVGFDAPSLNYTNEYVRADIAAVQPAQVRVKPLTDLVEEFTTAVWHLMDNSETSGPIDDPTITVWNPDFDEVSKLLDRIEGLPSGSTEHMGAGELLSANILAALEPQPDPRDEVIEGLTEALEWCVDALERDYRGSATDCEIPQDIRAALAAAKEVMK